MQLKQSTPHMCFILYNTHFIYPYRKNLLWQICIIPCFKNFLISFYLVSLIDTVVDSTIFVKVNNFVFNLLLHFFFIVYNSYSHAYLA